MAKALFLYSTCEGQTKKIFQHIDGQLDGYDCDFVDLHTIDDIDFEKYERVLVGASIRYGHLNKKLYQFIERNLKAIQTRKAAFFCVNLNARKEDQVKDTTEASAYINTFFTMSTRTLD